MPYQCRLMAKMTVKNLTTKSQKILMRIKKFNTS
jgi:hypothetical protein